MQLELLFKEVRLLATLQELVATYTSQSELTNLLESDKFGLVMVTSFGATGDGVTDDSVAIQQAIDFAIAQGSKSIWFKAGTYICSGLTDTASVNFVGDTATISSPYVMVNLNELADNSTDIDAVELEIGDLTALTTSDKTDLVSAINEVDSNADTNTTNISTNTTKILMLKRSISMGGFI